MDSGLVAGEELASCPECGQVLPLGTQRYCVRCGADVASGPAPVDRESLHDHDGGDGGDGYDGADGSAPPTPPRGWMRRPTTWAVGDYRAPAPTDGDDVPVPPEAPPGVEWNGPIESTDTPAAGAGSPAAQPVRLEAVHPADARSGGAPHTGRIEVPGAWRAFGGRRTPYGHTAAFGPASAVSTPYTVPPLDPAAAGEAWGATPAGPEPRRRARRATIVVVAAAVLVAGAAAAGLWTYQGGGFATTAASVPPPSAPAESARPATGVRPVASSSAADAPPASGVPGAPGGTFEVAMNRLLDQSQAARAGVSAAVTALESCRVTPQAAAATLRSASAARSALAAEAGLLDAAGVAGGSDAVLAFVTMQQASAEADEAFANWADDVAAAGCRTTAPHTVNWTIGNQHSAEATAAKIRFTELWNPLAAASGLPPRTSDGI